MAELSPAGNDRVAALMLIGCAVLWGGFFVFGKLAVAAAPPMLVALLRFALAGLVLAGLLAWKEPRAFRLRRGDWPVVLGLGATGVAAYNALCFGGLAFAPASDGAMISPSTHPVLTAFIAAWLFGEALTRRKLAGLLVASIGVVLVFGGPARAGGDRWLGDLMFLGSALTWSAYTLLGKVAVGRFSALATTTFASLAGLVLLVPFAWHDLTRADWAGLPIAFWANLAFMALGSTVAAFLLYFGAIRRIGAARTASFMYLVPVSGVLLGIVVLREFPAPLQLVGVVLAIGGVYWANRSPRAASLGEA